MTTTLLFLPGTACDHRVWQPVVEALKSQPKSAYTSHFVDFGQANSIRGMADIALNISLNIAAKNGGKIIPVGLSMGGLVALQMWRQAPSTIAGMVLCGCDPSTDSPIRAAARAQQMQAATTNGFAAMLDILADKYFVVNEKLRAENFAADNTAKITALNDCAHDMAQQQGLATLAAQYEALATREDSWPLLPSINIPALILCGEHDTICPPETHARIAALMPQASYKIVSKAAHLAPLQQPQQVAQYIDDWLKQNLGDV